MHFLGTEYYSQCLWFSAESFVFRKVLPWEKRVNWNNLYNLNLHFNKDLTWSWVGTSLYWSKKPLLVELIFSSPSQKSHMKLSKYFSSWIRKSTWSWVNIFLIRLKNTPRVESVLFSDQKIHFELSSYFPPQVGKIIWSLVGASLIKSANSLWVELVFLTSD